MSSLSNGAFYPCAALLGGTIYRMQYSLHFWKWEWQKRTQCGIKEKNNNP